ncbi:unnamed protein product [Alternaria alternata]
MSWRNDNSTQVAPSPTYRLVPPSDESSREWNLSQLASRRSSSQSDRGRGQVTTVQQWDVETGRDGETQYERLSEVSPNRPRPWRILCLDGGGVKGLAELLILKRLLRVIQNKTGSPSQKLPLPYEYFDIICGTSTGGLIALLIGRLRLSIDDAIKHFMMLAAGIFPGMKPNERKWSSRLEKVIKFGKNATGKPQFDGKNMERVLQRFLEKDLKLDPGIALLEDSACKTFVCATRNQTASKILFRSYRTTHGTPAEYDVSVWEAARATSAAPLIFEPFHIERHLLTVVDGALRLNNPIHEAISEADRIDESRGFGCVVSIGTGVMDIQSIPRSNVKMHQIAKTCVEISLNCEEVAQEFASSYEELTAVRASEVAFRVGQEEQTSRDVFYVKADTNEHAGRDLDRIAEILNPEAVIPTKLAAKMDVVEELLQDPALDPCTVIFDATGRKAREPIIPAPNFPVSPQKRLVVVDTLSKTEFPPAFHGGINVSFTKHFIYPLGTSPPLRKHRRLGYGVYGTVYLVTLQRDVDTEKATGERFALKVVRILDVSSKEGRSMETHLHLEVEIPKQMRHPHIAEVILSYEERVGFGLDFGYLMRPVAQCTMRNLVDVISGGKPPQIKPRWFACIASAVSYVHSKELIHGDIKPSNILIKDGEF